MKQEIKHLGDGIINIRIPFNIKRYSSKKLILSPDGDIPLYEMQPRPNNGIIALLVKAYKWQKKIDKDNYKTLKELVEKLQIDYSDAAHILTLNSLAPEIKEAILNGLQPATLTVTKLFEPFPALWDEQKAWFGFPTSD